MVQYRDVGYVLPVATQFLLYGTPIAYALNAVPESAQWAVQLNPLTGIVEGFRWAAIDTTAPSLLLTTWSAVASSADLLRRRVRVHPQGAEVRRCHLTSPSASRVWARRIASRIKSNRSRSPSRRCSGSDIRLRRAPSETFWALQDVDLEVKRGEVLGLIGRNGAGKSTLLKVLSRITPPTTGRVELFGRIGSLLEVGTGFHPELTGRENIYLNGSILGMKKPEIDRQFDDIVEFAGVERFLDTPVKRYSSGMYVRLAFAVAAHLETEILLIDEVLAVGDQDFQEKCIGKMHDVSTQGRTVIVVSHNLASVRQLAERCVLLDQGTVSIAGDVDEVLRAYEGIADEAWTPKSVVSANRDIQAGR